MKRAPYDIGDIVRVSFGFLNAADTPGDPTTATVKVLDPSGGVKTFGFTELIRDGLGEYHVDVSVDRSGVWTVRIEGAGALAAAREYSFRVRDTVFS